MSTWAQLTELGCELIQGYALAAPMPAAELEALLSGSPVSSRE